MRETILEVFKQRVNEFGPRPALLHKHGDAWEEQSWKEWWEQAERIAAGLMARGLAPGERVCVLANTRIEWVWIDMGITMAGGVVVPIYPSSLPKLCAHIATDSAARFVFAEDPSQLDKLQEVREQLDGVEEVIYLERDAVLASPDWRGRRRVRLEEVAREDDAWLTSFEVLVAEGRRRVADDHRYVAERRQQISPDSLATIIYTSGTSGVPKGVRHAHGSLVAELHALTQLELLTPGDRQLLFLPLAHIFAKVLFLAAIGTGSQTAFAENLPAVVTNLREVEPTFFAGVPRVFEKIHDQLSGQRGQFPGLDHGWFERAMERGLKFSRRRRQGKRLGPVARLEDAVYDKLVFERIQEIFGGNVRFLFSGGASLRADLAEFFHAAGVLILEGYGLTETAAVSTLNLPDDFRFGSVGKPLPHVDVTIDEDGEILIRGPMVMEGYHGMEAMSAEAIEAEERWFHTGDLGHFDRDGFLHVTGRKKHLIVTSGGKNIAPEQIEARLGEREPIKQAVVVGEGRPYLVALLTLDESIETWAIRQGISFEDRHELASNAAVRDRLEEEVAAINESLPHFETVRRFAVLDEPLTVSAGEITPTGKVRRAPIIEKYADLIDELYQ